jgi:hypothetical protein
MSAILRAVISIAYVSLILIYHQREIFTLGADNSISVYQFPAANRWVSPAQPILQRFADKQFVGM